MLLWVQKIVVPTFLILRENRAQTLKFSNKRKYVGSDVKVLFSIWPKLQPITILRDFRLSQRCYRRCQLSRMWRCVFGRIILHVSRYYIAAIFRLALRFFETSLYCSPATKRYVAEDLSMNHRSFISYRKLVCSVGLCNLHVHLAVLQERWNFFSLIKSRN